MKKLFVLLTAAALTVSATTLVALAETAAPTPHPTVTQGMKKHHHIKSHKKMKEAKKGMAAKATPEATPKK